METILTTTLAACIGFGFPFCFIPRFWAGRGRKGLAAPILTILFSLLAGLAVMGQGYDAQWALGYNESVLDFSHLDSVSINSLPTIEYVTQTNASICDSSGQLLYYTNGVSICGISDTLLYGTGLNPCLFTSLDSLNGLDIPQAAIFIPKPGNSRYYYLFHFSNNSNDNTRPVSIYYSVIDAYGNHGQGEVVSKNNVILDGIELREGGMTACKHANGRDYWLEVGVSNRNQFCTFLITPDSIIGPFNQSIGPTFPVGYDVAYSKFSSDGSKFATGIFMGAPVLVMDFDRCSGVFSNPFTIQQVTQFLPNPDSLFGCYALEFSPNGRFLYVSTPHNLDQYDLWSSDVQDSNEIFKGDSSDYYSIYMLQLAINGKLYASTWNGGLKALHVVNNPDLKGDSSGFVYGGQPTLTINSTSVPNLINYSLGPLLGSGCDTLPNGIPSQTINNPLRIIPNPANKYAYIEMGQQGNYQFNLLTPTGQLIAQKQTRQVDIFDTEGLSAGVYFVRVIDKTTGTQITTKKLVVMH